jgi:hypothetical protein
MQRNKGHVERLPAGPRLAAWVSTAALGGNARAPSARELELFFSRSVVAAAAPLSLHERGLYHDMTKGDRFIVERVP